MSILVRCHRTVQWSSAMEQCNGAARWSGAMERRDGAARWSGAMERRDGAARWSGAMERRNGAAQWSGAMEQCNGCYKCCKPCTAQSTYLTTLPETRYPTHPPPSATSPAPPLHTFSLSVPISFWSILSLSWPGPLALGSPQWNTTSLPLHPPD